MQKKRELSLLIFSISTSFICLFLKIYNSSNIMAILYLTHFAVTKSFLALPYGYVDCIGKIVVWLLKKSVGHLIL